MLPLITGRAKSTCSPESLSHDRCEYRQFANEEGRRSYAIGTRVCIRNSPELAPARRASTTISLRSALPDRLVKGNRRRGGVISHYIFATVRNGLSIYTGRRAFGPLAHAHARRPVRWQPIEPMNRGPRGKTPGDQASVNQ